MKKVIALGISSIMVMGLAAVANAGIDTDWILSIRGYSQAGTLSSSLSESRFGTKSTALVVDYMKAGDDSALPSDVDGTKVWVYDTLKTSATNANPKKVGVDTTASITAIDMTRQWNITVAGGSSFYGSGYSLKAWNETALGDAYTIGRGIKLDLYQVAAFGGTRTLVWSKDEKTNLAGTEASAGSIWSTTFAEGDVPTYRFELVATGAPEVTPEPGSIVAMLSGLVGLAGFGIRRRK